MKTLALIVALFAAVSGWAQNGSPDGARPGGAQPPTEALNGKHRNSSGPLAWVSSDINPKTLFWIQGRFVPAADSNYQGHAEVVTILCSIREYECLEIESTSPLVRGEQVWIADFKPASWDNTGILATTRSLDGCTDETLKIHFSPPSVVLINSPVLPTSENCKKVNNSWDTLLRKSGSGIAAQMEEDMLVPTRGPFPFQDIDSEVERVPTSALQKKP
ncbi:MAG TPA: hypothetical protein VM554_00940 [Acidisarcina sp.]|nr:hypothetical protein [Acidisarcina sp.]